VEKRLPVVICATGSKMIHYFQLYATNILQIKHKPIVVIINRLNQITWTLCHTQKDS